MFRHLHKFCFILIKKQSFGQLGFCFQFNYMYSKVIFFFPFFYAYPCLLNMMQSYFLISKERDFPEKFLVQYILASKAHLITCLWLFDQLFIPVTKSIGSYVVSLLQRCVHTNWITRASALRNLFAHIVAIFRPHLSKKIMFYCLYFRFFTFIPFPQLWLIFQNLFLILRGMCNERKSCIRTAFDL